MLRILDVKINNILTQWLSINTNTALEKSNLSYEVIDRQLGRIGHINRTHGHYYRSNVFR